MKFVEFLKTGQLGSIKTGISRSVVKAALGEPSDVSTRLFKNGLPAIEKYGNIEIGYEQNVDKILYIQIDLNKGEMPNGPELLNLESNNVAGGMSIEELEKFLSSNNIAYEKFEEELNPDLMNLKTIGGVILSIAKKGSEFSGVGLVNVRTSV